MQLAAAELLSLSWCDYHIIGFGSGFGKVGAFLHPPPRNIWVVQGKTPKCGPNDTISLYSLMSDWSGL